MCKRGRIQWTGPKNHPVFSKILRRTRRAKSSVNESPGLQICTGMHGRRRAGSGTHTHVRARLSPGRTREGAHTTREANAGR